MVRTILIFLFAVATFFVALFAMNRPASAPAAPAADKKAAQGGQPRKGADASCPTCPMPTD